MTQIRHFVSTTDANPVWVLQMMRLTARIKAAYKQGPDSDEWRFFSTLLKRRLMLSLFYEPSTRTSFSFESAMNQLGGMVTKTEAASIFSSTVKGESTADTIRVVAGYGHIIVMRHNMTGEAKVAMEASPVPLINAGDGKGEHPTQALLDLFTIWEMFQETDGLTLTVVGDLRRGRTVHSLIKLAASLKGHKLGMIDTINYIAPEDMQIDGPFVLDIDEQLVQACHTELTPAIVAESDIIYMTRTQSERDDGSVSSSAFDYQLTPDLAGFMRDNSMILHPLPRNDELPTELDEWPQARYFEQAQNGLFVRMALLLWALNKVPAE